MEYFYILTILFHEAFSESRPVGPSCVSAYGFGCRDICSPTLCVSECVCVWVRAFHCPFVCECVCVCSCVYVFVYVVYWTSGSVLIKPIYPSKYLLPVYIHSGWRTKYAAKRRRERRGDGGWPEEGHSGQGDIEKYVFNIASWIFPLCADQGRKREREKESNNNRNNIQISEICICRVEGELVCRSYKKYRAW